MSNLNRNVQLYSNQQHELLGKILVLAIPAGQPLSARNQRSAPEMSNCGAHKESMGWAVIVQLETAEKERDV